jgi:hypothetical protein
MRTRNVIFNLLWGIILIAAGLVLLGQNLGWIPEFTPQVWGVLMLGASLLFFVFYFVSGLRSWGWLFPAFICAGVAVTIFLGLSGLESAAVGAPVLIGVGLPFVAVYILNRRENAWALIPAWVMLMVTLLLLVVEQIPGEWVAALVMYAIGLPFLFVFLASRRHAAGRPHAWALIPAFVMLVIGTIPLLARGASGEVVGAFVMFAIALPFVVVALWSRSQWWAIIPAGIMGTIGVVVLLSGWEKVGWGRVAFWNGILYLGWALTFGILWLLRGKHPTGWAKWPALGLAIMAAIALVFDRAFVSWWPVAVILVGVVILAGALWPKRK